MELIFAELQKIRGLLVLVAEDLPLPAEPARPAATASLELFTKLLQWDYARLTITVSVCAQDRDMKTKYCSTVKAFVPSPGSLITAGTLLLLCSHLPAQSDPLGDPFKKAGAPPLQPEVAQPVYAETFQEIADRAKPGILGIAVCDFQKGSLQGANLTRAFSLQSVAKIFVAAVIMSQVDSGQLTLDQVVTIQPNDVEGGSGSLDNSRGGNFPVRDLLRKALIESDNTAADAILRLAGGPAKVTAWLQGKGIKGVRIDRDLRTMGRDESGLPQNLPSGGNRLASGSPVSKATREAAFQAAESDPRDTATPEGAIHFLVALKKGALLSAASSDLLLAWLQEAKTGQGRLRAGFSAQTVLAHKTGTSIEFDGVRLATNDIGLATFPNGRTIAIVAFLASAPGSDETRDAILAACARAAAKTN